jgi:hypothetical protein
MHDDSTDKTSATEKDIFIWDAELKKGRPKVAPLSGFGLRQRGERKSFIIQYRVAGRPRRLKIGDAHIITEAQARESRVASWPTSPRGIDPAAARDAEREAAQHTLGATAAIYLKHKQRDGLRLNSLRELSQLLGWDRPGGRSTCSTCDHTPLGNW